MSHLGARYKTRILDNHICGRLPALPRLTSCGWGWGWVWAERKPGRGEMATLDGDFGGQLEAWVPNGDQS